GALDRHIPTRAKPEVNGVRLECRQRICKSHARHHRAREVRLPMPPQARDIRNGAPGEALREIPPNVVTRTVAPHIGSQQGGGNSGYRGGRQVIRKITLETFRIVHDGLCAIRQRFVEVEENPLRHDLFLHYGRGEATERWRLQCEIGCGFWYRPQDSLLLRARSRKEIMGVAKSCSTSMHPCASVSSSSACITHRTLGRPPSTARGVNAPWTTCRVNVGDDDEGIQVKDVRLLALQRHRLLHDVHCRSGCASARGRLAGLGGAARQRRGCQAETG